jgi:hypothetical protein
MLLTQKTNVIPEKDKRKRKVNEQMKPLVCACLGIPHACFAYSPREKRVLPVKKLKIENAESLCILCVLRG